MTFALFAIVAAACPGGDGAFTRPRCNGSRRTGWRIPPRPWCPSLVSRAMLNASMLSVCVARNLWSLDAVWRAFSDLRTVHQPAADLIAGLRIGLEHKRLSPACGSRRREVRHGCAIRSEDRAMPGGGPDSKPARISSRRREFVCSVTAYALCRRLESSDSFHCGAKVNTPVLPGLEKYSLMSKRSGCLSASLSRSERLQKLSLMFCSAVGAVSKTGRIVSLRGVTVSTADANSLPLMSLCREGILSGGLEVSRVDVGRRRARDLPPDRRRFRLPASTAPAPSTSASEASDLRRIPQMRRAHCLFRSATDDTEWYRFPSVSLPSLRRIYQVFFELERACRHPRSQPRGWCIRPGWGHPFHSHRAVRIRRDCD